MHIDAIFGAIGRWAVRFRWLVILVWVVGAIAAVTQLPSLGSVTQSNNSKFLPASAPSQHAIDLSAPFGNATLVPIPIIAATTSGPLTPADIAALTTMGRKIAADPNIKQVKDVGQSANGQAVQVLALASGANGGNQNYALDLVNGLRARIASSGLPAGLRAHLAGDTAVQVDEQKASGNTGNKVQDLSLVFIIALLVLIFRSLTLAVTTVLPALMSVLISGPLVAEAAKHGLQVSPLAQFRLIVLVLRAGARPGPCRAVRSGRAPAGRADRARRGGHPGWRVDHLLGRHGHRGGADPAGGQLPVLLQPRHPVCHCHRSHPAGGPDAAARTAVNPDVAAGGEADDLQGDLPPAQTAAVEHPGQRRGRDLGPGGGPHRAPPRADADRGRGGVRCRGARRPRLLGGRLRRHHESARRQRLRGGHGAAD